MPRRYDLTDQSELIRLWGGKRDTTIILNLVTKKQYSTEHDFKAKF